MPNPTKFRLAGQAIPVLNTILDIGNVGYELVNPNEPRRAQRLLNAAVVGGGNIGAGIFTGGADVIPQLLGAFGVKSPVQNVNPDAQLRRLAYRLGQGKEIGLHNEQQDAAIRQIAQKVQREQMLNPEEIRLIKQVFSSGTY